ncbi:MAG: hypothetical protein ACJAT7_003221 [Psychromonas sp.]|jgi:hypothetical protein
MVAIMDDGVEDGNLDKIQGRIESKEIFRFAAQRSLVQFAPDNL